MSTRFLEISAMDVMIGVGALIKLHTVLFLIEVEIHNNLIFFN